MRSYFQEQAILWLTRAFDHTDLVAAEECLDNAIAGLRTAANETPGLAGAPEACQAND